MATEIERKFLVKPEKEAEFRQMLNTIQPLFIHQGYLAGKGLVRVRTIAYEDVSEAFLTIKGPGLHTRKEFEYGIPLDDAEYMLDNLCKSQILKERFKIPYQGHTFEVDRFSGLNDQVLIEVETATETEEVALPEWVGKEVTHDKRYSNANIASNGWPEEPHDLI